MEETQSGNDNFAQQRNPFCRYRIADENSDLLFLYPSIKINFMSFDLG